MKIGYKIHKIRELKNITAKDMADRLNLTSGGYNKIERDEVTINLERLEEIAGIFEMKPVDLLTFDEKVVFNIINSPFHGTNGHQTNTGDNHYHFPEEIKKLYEENAKLQADKIAIQAKMIEMLEEKMKGFEGK
jgi:transcriptional regulator with XRE-family HTH domain